MEWKGRNMKLARLGNFGSEKAAIVISDTEAVFVDDVVADFNRETLSNGALDKLKKLYCGHHLTSSQ